jgi:two-component system CheB/CheR fusion protein
LQFGRDAAESASSLQARQRLAADAGAPGEVEIDPRTLELRCSSRALALLETTTPPAGRDWLQLVHPEDRAAVEAAAESSADEVLSVRLLSRPRLVLRLVVARDDGVARLLGLLCPEQAAPTPSVPVQDPVKTALAIVRVLARRTRENAVDLDAYASHLDGRLAALARVHGALGRHQAGADLEELVREELLQHTAEDMQGVSIAGPPMRLAGSAAEYIALALHELAVNAMKFGALTVPGARLSVTWERQEGPSGAILSFSWREDGVPILATNPRRIGFGRQLLEQGLPYQLGAQTRFSFEPGGLRFDLEFTPADAEAEA